MLTFPCMEKICLNYSITGDEGQLGFAATPGKESEFRNSLDKAIKYASALDCDM